MKWLEVCLGLADCGLSTNGISRHLLKTELAPDTWMSEITFCGPRYLSPVSLKNLAQMKSGF